MCDQDQLYLLEIVANVFVIVLFIVKFCVCDLNMPRALEININDRFMWQHVECCSSTTKNIKFPLP